MRGILLLIVCTIGLGAVPARPGEPQRYDPASIETVSGAVVRVELVPHPGRSTGMQLVLRTQAGDEIPVALGPQWAVERGGFHLEPGDQIAVTGVRVVRGKPALLAAEVTKGERTQRLRDRYGVPVWASHHPPGSG